MNLHLGISFFLFLWYFNLVGFSRKGKVIIMAKKENEELSKSKTKRDERRKEVKKEKRHKLVTRIIGIVIAVAIVGALAVAIGFNIYKVAIRTTSSSDFSANLTEQGFIDGVNAEDYITLADYESLVIPKDEVAATTEEVDENIQSSLEANKEISTDSTLTIADGDKVNIDYVGTINGEEFEGGSSDGAGYDLTIGSGSFIDDFEEQLIGHKPGEKVTVEVTFPTDYSSADLAGQDASFAVTIHGIYVTPELTDEFVQEHFSDVASSADEYRAYLENNYYEQHLEEYLDNFVIDNSTVNSYPKSYLKTLKSLIKYNDEYTLSYYNQMFSQYGVDTYENVWDTRDGIENEVDYEHELTTRAKDSAKEAMVYQAIFQKAGLTMDMDTYLAEMTEENGEDYVTSMQETYGTGYMAQSRIKELVMDYLMENANVQ